MKIVGVMGLGRFCFCLVILLQSLRDVVCQTRSCVQPERFMRNESVQLMKQMKSLQFSLMSTGEIGNAVEMSRVSPCLAGDLLVDLETARRFKDEVAVAVSSELRSRRARAQARSRRSYYYDFVGQEDHKWATTIPYTYRDLTDFNGASTKIPAALEYIQQQTCLRFQRTTNYGSPYLSFVSNDSCTTFYGKSTDSRDTKLLLTSDCANQFGVVLNLLAGVLGQLNENVRIDKDSWIYINRNKVNPSNLVDLEALEGPVIASPYDYASITHVPSKKFTTDGSYTVLPLNPLYLKVIGQRVEWSFLDIKAVNEFYCNGTCSNTLSCQQGGYPDPTRCSQCKCPDGFAGTLCNQLTPSTGGCGSQQLTATFGDQYISSPGYGTRQYSPNTTCTWRISPGVSNRRIQIKFIGVFGLNEEDGTGACRDWVEIRYQDGLGVIGPRFCGSRSPILSLVTNVGGEVLVLFRTRSVSNSGFRLLYRLVSCETTFQTYVGKHSTGGSRVEGPLSADGCRDYCAYDRTDCVAVDVDTADPSTKPYPACWLHTNPGNLNELFDRADMRQHRVTRRDCRITTGLPTTTTSTSTSTSTSTTTTSTSTTTTTPATTRFVCPSWTPFPNTNTLGAQQDLSARSVDQCKARCLDDPRCVAIDWDTRGSWCWIQRDASRLNDRYTTTGVTQYVLQRCPTSSVQTTTPTTTTTTMTRPGTCPAWTRLANTNSHGGTRDASVTSLFQCQVVCLNNANCLAIDWSENDAPRGCWFHTDPNRLQSKSNTHNVHQYILLRCLTSPQSSTTSTSTSTTGTSLPPTPEVSTTTTTPGGCPRWIYRKDRHSAFGRQETSVWTLQQCQNLCFGDPRCLAIDWNTNEGRWNRRCWVHTNWNHLVDRYSTGGIHQYELVRCGGVSFTTTSTSTSTSTTTTTTTTTPSTIPRMTTGPPVGCQPTWTIRNRTHSAYGRCLRHLAVLDACLHHCATTLSCVAVDFNTQYYPRQCWVHSDRGTLRQTFYNAYITQFEILTRCTSQPAPPAPCGGYNARPGQLCAPCMGQSRPRRMCVENRWTTSWWHGRWYTRIVPVNVPCQVPSCYSGAHLATINGSPKCVWVGWTDWSPCSSHCRGQQHRYYWNLMGGSYRVNQYDQRSCSSWYC